MRRLMRRLRTRTAAFVHDLCMIPVAWLGAYWLRFNLGDVPGLYWDTAVSLLPLVHMLLPPLLLSLLLLLGVRYASAEVKGEQQLFSVAAPRAVG